MKSEVHIVLIWEKGLNKLDSILYDLKNDFEILDVSKVEWSDSSFSNNLSRFYGQKLPNGSFKEKHCGRGPFIVAIIKQDSPIYESRKTSRGKERVNSILFDKKQLYRKWTGGGHKVHTSNSSIESEHDLFFLFQKSSDYFLNEEPWNGQIKNRKMNIKGCDGWLDFKELFDFINRSSNYVMLRNYENLEDLSPDSDIDILTSDIDFCYYINGSRKHRYMDRAAYQVRVNNNEYDVDVRLVDDGYYDSNWGLDIMKNRILHENKFFIPDPINEFYSLLYHVLIHKNNLSNKYNNKLINLSSKIDLKLDYTTLGDRDKMLSLLNGFLSKKGYDITNPDDFSVQYNHSQKGFKRTLWELVGRLKNGW